MEEAEMEVVVAEEVDVVWGQVANVEKVMIVAEFAEAEVAAVKVEVSMLPAEVMGGGRWSGRRRDGGGVDKGVLMEQGEVAHGVVVVVVAGW